MEGWESCELALPAELHVSRFVCTSFAITKAQYSSSSNASLLCFSSDASVASLRCHFLFKKECGLFDLSTQSSSFFFCGGLIFLFLSSHRLRSSLYVDTMFVLFVSIFCFKLFYSDLWGLSRNQGLGKYLMNTGTEFGLGIPVVSK